LCWQRRLKTDDKKERELELRENFLLALESSESDLSSKSIPKRSAGTCDWFFDTEQYSKWIDEPQPQTLVITAPTGRGKSVLANYLVERLQHNGEDNLILSCFCKDEKNDRKKAMPIVRHLLYQLLSGKTELLRHIPRRALIMEGEKAFTFQNLWDVMMDVLRVSSLKTVFCIIDGLDECDEESSKMLREAFERDVLSTYPTSRPVRARFLITSQPIEAALLLAQKSIYLGILPEHVNNDILEYVHDGIKSLKRVGAEMKISQELAGYIGEEITQRAGGSFQWAKLVLKELGRVPTSRNRIMQVLEQVPKSLQGLYEACFRKISPERLPKARRILTILLFSSRALTPGELAICMLENPNQYRAHAQVEGDFDHSMGWEANITCGSFLDVTDKFVNITHQSARESLMSFTPQHSSSNDFVPFDTEEGHRVLAMSCLSYLLLDDIQKVSSEDQDETLGEKFPFLKYAEANWHIHLRNVRNLEGFTGVLQDFLSRSTLRIRPWRSAWPEMLECFPRWEGSQDSAIFHLLVHTGLLTLLKRCELVPRGTGIDTIFGRLFDGAGLRPQAEAPILRLVAEIEDEDALGNTPLLRAMKKFNWDVTFWLFLNKYADLSAVNDQGCTISHFAAQADSEDFIWMLRLWRVDTNRVDGFGYTPLKYALLWGCENAARALLQNTPARDLRSDITPLHLVAKSGYETLLPLALKRGRGVGVNQGTISKTTGLMMASERGHDGIVLRLLAEQADADLKDDQGMSALHYAALEGKDKIVQILLDHGVLPDEIDDLERTALHLAAQGGYEEAVRHLLPKVSDLDARDVDGSTALYHAAAANCLSIVKLLVGRGADINQASRVGRTPFHVATVLGHFDVARFFAEQSDILLDTVTDKGYTPLCSAASNGFEEIVSLLLCHNVDVEGKADSKDMSDRLMTPLQLAADNGFQTIVERLVGAKALVNSVSRDGYTPLLCAAVRNHPKIVSFLLEKGANPDCVASTGWNPLHCAARDGHEGLVTRFLELGVDASSRTTSGLTPIYLACENGSIRILEILIGWGGNVRATSDSGSTPLHAAVGNEREDVVRRLIRMKVYVSQETDKGTTPLILAAGKDNPGIMKLLLENGASCQEPPPECWSPLHEAAFGGLEKNVALLLKHHHPVDALDEGETTPLLWAANQGHVLVVKTLLSNNANIKALSKTGLSFLICAVRSRSEALVRLGVEKGADINWANSVSDSPIAISIDQGDRKLFNIFLSQGALLLAEPVAKRTALHQAAQSGFEGIVQDLLAAGSDPNVRDIYGCTPLHLAAWCYRKATVRTLVDHGGDLRALDCFGRTGYYWARRRFNHGLGKSNRVLVPELEPIHHRQRLEQSIRFCVEKLLQHQIEHYHYYHYSILGKCLQFEGDSENARIAFEQTMHQTRHPNMVHIASCNVCGPDRGIEGCRYVCGSCADIDLCSRCFEGKWNPGLLGRGCFSHKFLQVPGPDWESRPAGVVDSHGLTVEEWLRGLRTPRSAGLQNWEKGTWTKTEQQMQSRPGFWDLIDTFSGSADDVRKEKEEEELSDISTENSGAEKDEQEKDETTDWCDQPRL
jgi:ankyrin repeat protein